MSKNGFVVLGAVLVGLGLLSLVPGIGGALAGLGAGLHEANMAYLSQSVQAVEHEAVILGESLAILEVLESTELGAQLVVSANVTVGHALSTLIRAAETGLSVALVFLAVLSVWEALLTVAQALFGPLLGITLSLVGLTLLATVWPWARSIRPALRIAAEVSVMVLFLFHIGLPYALNMAGAVTERVVATTHDHTGPVLLHAELTKQGAGADPADYWTKNKVLRQSLEGAVKNSASKTSALRSSWLDRLTYMAMSGLVFPLLALAILWAVWTRVARLLLRELDRAVAKRAATEGAARKSE